MRLSQLVAEYLSHRRALGCRFNSEGYLLRAFCRDMGDPPPVDINAARVREFLCSGQVTQQTVAKRRCTVAGLYRYAHGRYRWTLPELPQLPAGGSSRFVPYIYTAQDLKRLMDAASMVCGVRHALIEDHVLRTLLLLLYGAGLRLGEALSLNLADVDLGEAVLMVRETKFYKTRLVPVGQDLKEVLTAYRLQRDRRYPHDPDHPFLCLRNAKRLNHAVTERTYRRLRAAAGVVRGGGPRNQPRLHDLRHTAAVHRLTRWYQDGANVQYLLPRLATYMGHKDLSGTQRYLTLTPQLLHEASLRFERYTQEDRHV